MESKLNQVLRHLRQLVVGGGLDSDSDGQLLERYVRHQDAAAFEALVERHGPLVLGVCRRLLPEPHDAEDAFQATFLVLVRKADSIARQASVGSWLYGVAYRTAARLRASGNRRHIREVPLPDLPDSGSADEPGWSELRPLLDEEINRLPEKYRAPMVLCYFEGKTNDEAAAQLRWPKGTVQGRLARAREMLRNRLARRGLAFAPSLLGGLIAAGAAEAVPLPLLRVTVKAADVVAAATPALPGAISPAVAILYEGVLRDMFLKKIRRIAALALFLSLVVAGGGLLAQKSLAERPTVPPDKDPVAAAGAVDLAKPDGVPKALKPMVSWTGPQTPTEKEAYHRITTAKEWQDVWERHVGKNGERGRGGVVLVPQVNFDDCMVVAIFGGSTVNTDGYSPASITDEADMVRFRFQANTYQTLGPDGGAVPVTPYAFFVLPRSQKPLVLEGNVQRLLGEKPVWKEMARFKP